MKPPTHIKILALALAVPTWSHAVDRSWDFGGTPSLLWSTAANWSADTVPLTTDNAVFSSATGTSSAATVTSIVGSSISITNLTYTQSGSFNSFHTTEINSGQTLTVTGNFNMNTVAGAPKTATTTIKNGTGSGTLTASGAQFRVGVTADTVSTLDLSGLSSFNYTNAAGNLDVGYVPGNSIMSGILKMAETNSITAANVRLGANNQTSATNAEITLGSSNAWNVNTIVVAEQKQNASISFQTGLTNAGITIRGATGGSSRANLNLGVTSTTTTSSSVTGTFDLTGATGSGTVDVLLGVVKLGEKNHINAAGSATGVLSFNRGTIDATSILAGSAATSAFTSTSGGIGTINVSGNGTLTQSGTGSTDFILGRRNVATAATGTPVVSSGTLNVSGTAVVTVNASQLTLGDNSATGDDSVSAIVNLNGGTLAVKKVAAGSSTGGSANVRIVNFSGGELKALASDSTFLEGLTTANVKDGGAKVNTNGFDITIGQQLVHFAGATTDSLTKSGAGTLTLSAANTYIGVTTVSAGTLLISSAGSLASASAVTVANGAAIGGDGTVNGNLTLSSGAKFVFDLNITPLTVGGTFALDSSFGVSNLVTSSLAAIDWSTVSVGTYNLIGTSSSFNSGNISNFGIANAFTSGGKQMYFANGSLDLVVAVPEPSTWALLAFSLTTVMVLRRRRKSV